MRRSILEAIREGDWSFEPCEAGDSSYHSTVALPGTDEKLGILAQRAERGLPLWHDSDRLTFDQRAEE